MSQQTTNQSLDEVARALANGSISRGKALRLMGGLFVGSALASIPGAAWADDDRCSEGQTRCGDRCVNLQRNERHCGSCSNRCRSNQTCCKGRCVNLQRNERHCGSCFNRCAEGEECVGGVCQGGCPSGTTVCGGNCLPDCPQGQLLDTFTCLCQEFPSVTIQCECSNGVFNTCQEDAICNLDPLELHFICSGMCGGEDLVRRTACIEGC